MGVYVYGYNYEPGKISTTVYPLTGAGSTGYLFGLNTTDGSTAAESTDAWDVGHLNGIFGIFVDNTPNDLAGVRLCVFAKRTIGADLWGFGVTQLLKHAGDSTAYADSLRFENIQSHASLDNSEYLVDLGEGGGDTIDLYKLYFSPYENGGTPEKAIKVQTSNDASIRSVINGGIYLKNCYGSSIENWHTECASLIVDRSTFALRDSTLEAVDGATGYYPIDLLSDGGTTQNMTAVLENVEFKYGLSGREGHVAAQIRTTKQYTIRCTNVFRSILSANGNSHTGIFINNDSDAAVTAWNDNAGYLSVNGTLACLQPVGSYAFNITTNDFQGVYNAVTKVTKTPTTLVNGTTYYYKSQLLIDKTNLVGLTGTASEMSTTMTTASQRIFIPVFWGTCPSLATLRVYRGTSTGNYDKKADIPSVHCRSIQDDGTYVNGIAWEDWGPGAVATLVSAIGNHILTPQGRQQVNGHQAITSAAAPAVNCAAGNIITLTASNATVTFGAPSNVPRAGDTVTFVITQDGTGGRTIAWNAAYIFPTAWSNTGNTANKKSTITFVSDGTNLIAQGANSWY